MKQIVKKFMEDYGQLYKVATLKQMNKIGGSKIIDCPLCKERHSVAQIPYLHIIVNGKIFNNRNPSGKFLEIQN